MAREPDLNGLGRVVAGAQDAELAARGESDRERVRAALLRETPAPVQERAASHHALVPALVAIAAAIAVVLLWPAAGEKVPFRVGRSAGRVGAWIAAHERRELPVRFRDGTRIVLSAGGRARVAEVSPEGARVVLERGQAHVAVVHRADTRWLVHVGPYEVTVTGTEFDVSWDPASEAFDLSMERGRVRVTGPMIEEGRSVVAGESLSAVVRDHRLTVEADEEPVPMPPPEPAPAEQPEPAPEPAPAEPAPAPVASEPRPPAPSPAPADWSALARAGQYEDAIAAAEAAGFARICATASGSDLLLLADAARYGGKLPRATEALETVRRRFAGSRPAAQAAFTLGRIAFDRRGAYGEAARWFATYMREAPGGPLSREAAGRRLEALVRASDIAAAREAASEYLARYPNGPHTDLARRFSTP